MWEWRVFAEPGRLAVPRVLRERAPRTRESRADVYVIIRGRPDAGLKVRGDGGPSAKAELKLRYETRAGAEYWAKVFEKRLPLDPDWARVLIEALGGDPGAARPIADASDLARLARGAGLATDELVRLEKTIEKTPAPPALELEHTTLVIEGRTFETLAIEAPTIELLEAERERHGLAPTPCARVQGYPERLASLSGEP